MPCELQLRTASLHRRRLQRHRAGRNPTHARL